MLGNGFLSIIQWEMCSTMGDLRRNICLWESQNICFIWGWGGNWCWPWTFSAGRQLIALWMDKTGSKQENLSSEPDPPNHLKERFPWQLLKLELTSSDLPCSLFIIYPEDLQPMPVFVFSMGFQFCFLFMLQKLKLWEVVEWLPAPILGLLWRELGRTAGSQH